MIARSQVSASLLARSKARRTCTATSSKNFCVQIARANRDHGTLGQQQRGAQTNRITATGINDDMLEAAGQLLAFGQDRLTSEAGGGGRRVVLRLTTPSSPARGRGLRVADEPEADGSQSEAALDAASNGTAKGKKGKKGNATDGNPSKGAVNGILTGARTHAGS